MGGWGGGGASTEVGGSYSILLLKAFARVARINAHQQFQGFLLRHKAQGERPVASSCQLRQVASAKWQVGSPVRELVYFRFQLSTNSIYLCVRFVLFKL